MDEKNANVSVAPVQQGRPAEGETQPVDDKKVQIQLGNTDVLKIKMMERIIQQLDIIIKQNDTIINHLKPKQ